MLKWIKNIFKKKEKVNPIERKKNCLPDEMLTEFDERELQLLNDPIAMKHHG